MPIATFTNAYDYAVPGRPTIVAYPAGYSGNIPQAHIDAATVAGAIVKEAANDDRRPAK